MEQQAEASRGSKRSRLILGTDASQNQKADEASIATLGESTSHQDMRTPDLIPLGDDETGTDKRSQRTEPQGEGDDLGEMNNSTDEFRDPVKQ